LFERYFDYLATSSLRATIVIVSDGVISFPKSKSNYIKRHPLFKESEFLKFISELHQNLMKNGHQKKKMIMMLVVNVTVVYAK
jgi:hypothetical protein